MMPAAMNSAQAAADANDNRRIAERHDVTGADVQLLMDGTLFTVHLKDISKTGICGLTDAPLAAGQMVSLMLDRGESVAAEIKWIRRALIGAAFSEPLSEQQVAKVRRNHSARRKG
jgi:hypothetical protein